MTKKIKKGTKEIRINIPIAIHDKIKQQGKENVRSVGKQAEWSLIREYK